MPAKRKTSIPESSPEAINENLGKRVKKLRADRGWSLEELANASGVSRSMLSEIEREKANPTLTVTFRLALCLSPSLFPACRLPLRGDGHSCDEPGVGL